MSASHTAAPAAISTVVIRWSFVWSLSALSSVGTISRTHATAVSIQVNHWCHRTGGSLAREVAGGISEPRQSSLTSRTSSSLTPSDP
ncbi:hypothetical protein [Amycolatopsis sp. WGS_07]|uniref:hypothetical protein n=1 Tax=Amycolatopsis sp. WGS_07 TaxID=3076764 RepID=UPI003873AEEA